jgi:hypothetical protein
MNTTRAGEAVRSLAHIEPRQHVRIRSILFSTLREFCRDIGLHEGDEVVCRRASATILVLRAANGRTVLLERDRARFIEVDRSRASPDPID